MLLTMLKHFVRIFVRCWGQATVSHDILHSVDYANPGTKAIMYDRVILTGDIEEEGYIITRLQSKVVRRLKTLV